MGAAWMSIGWDMNGDGRFTSSDAWLWVVRGFFVPGDSVLWALLTYAPNVASFFGLSQDGYAGLVSGVASFLIWMCTLVIAGTVYGLVIDFDRALTGKVSRYYCEWLRRVRIARQWVFCHCRRLIAAIPSRRPRQQRQIDLGEIELAAIELEVLRSHALLAPGYVMSASDLAGALEIRRSEASRLLDRLEKLSLLQRSFSTDEDESGYRLSRPGHFPLMARTRSADD